MAIEAWTQDDYIEHAVAMLMQRADFLVSQCEIYMSRMRNSPDDARVRENESILMPHTSAFREAEDDRTRLEASESLADVVSSAIISRHISDRTLPDDALLLYRDPSGDKCEICTLPDARSYVNNMKICTKCLLKLEW
ncbi:MAG: hypothetical protein ABIS59_00195 [Candidatus Saccharibacteria bacterium]